MVAARALCEAAQNIFGTLDSTLILGDICAMQGEPRLAAQLYRQVLAEAERAAMDRNEALARTGQALAGLAELALEWNDLAAAEEHAARALDIGRRRAFENLEIRAGLTQAGVLHAHGETEAARQKLLALAARISRRPLLREIQARLARLALAAGDLPAARRWLAAGAPDDDNITAAIREQDALVRARTLIAEGRPAAAIRALEAPRADARAAGRARAELEALVLSALARAALGERRAARRALLRALALARPAGYVRLFLGEGAPLAALLTESVERRAQSDPIRIYAERLLSAFPAEQLGAMPHTPDAPPVLRSTLERSNALVEALSPQEQRILTLLASGHSNPQMAQALVVSVNTIKTHVKSIYRKLNVSNRVEACNIGRRLNLL
jgi:LuxR family maltose regulon positive regulatory protein